MIVYVSIDISMHISKLKVTSAGQTGSKIYSFHVSWIIINYLNFLSKFDPYRCEN